MSPELGPPIEGQEHSKECATGFGFHPDSRKREDNSDFYHPYSLSSS